MGNKNETNEGETKTGESINSIYSIEDVENYQEANFLWLDANINIGENLMYQDTTKKVNNIKFFPFTETKNCIEKIKEIRYQKTFILVSGSLLNEFYQEFIEIINQIEILPEIIVFTRRTSIPFIKEKIIEKNNPLFDVDSIYYNFKKVQNRLKKENLYIPEPRNTMTYQRDETFTFEYIKESRDLILPLYFTDFIEYPTKSDIATFNKFILDICSENKEMTNLMQQLIISNISIPCQILIKYYLRAYTIESNFCYDMNHSLIYGNNEDIYDTYIKVCYNSLLLKYIEPSTEKKLFIGARIKKGELEYIKNSFSNKKENLPACICYNKSFLSSSYQEIVALKFMIRREKKGDEEYVIYEFEKGTELDNLNGSNSNIEKYSFYEKNEGEILFFPFSSFEITKLPEESEYKAPNGKAYSYYRIYLNYLGKYKEKIIMNEKIPESNFSTIILKTEILEKFQMEKKSEIFDFDIKNYISRVKRKNSIIAIYEINNDDINKEINILNCNDSNKEEIKKLCTIYSNDKKLNFDFIFTFNQPGRYTFYYEFNDLLTNASKLFYGCNILISLDFSKFKTNYLTDMSHMFNGCSSLKSLDLSNFKTNSVTNMEYLFYDCNSLENLDVSSFDTLNVTKMDYMFGNCISLPQLNLSSFETKRVESMQGMFSNCKALIGLNISNFKTDETINMSEMFYCCSELKSINLSTFNTFNVKQMNKMFCKCSSLTSLDITNFITKNVITMEKMFTECSSLTSLNLSNFETNEVNNTAEMFKKCTSLVDLNTVKFDIKKVTNDKNMFIECKSLKTLTIGPKFIFTEKSINGMNRNCKIIYDGKDFVSGEIIDHYNEDKVSIKSNYTNKALFGEKENDSESSIRSNPTLNLLLENGIIN